MFFTPLYDVSSPLCFEVLIKGCMLVRELPEIESESYKNDPVIYSELRGGFGCKQKGNPMQI